MKSKIFQIKDGKIDFPIDELIEMNPELILVFGEREKIEDKKFIGALKGILPKANIVSGTTSGEIFQQQVTDDTVVVSALSFDKTELAYSIANIDSFSNSYDLGQYAAQNLPKDELKYVMVMSDGNKVNGTELTKSLTETFGKDVLVTGGLAGDKARFEKTLVGLNENISEGNLVLIGFYGDAINVRHGLKGGWDVFGPERVITKADKNVLYEIDGENALDLYKKYLGKYAEELPGSALLFPLAIKGNSNDESLVRTILSIDEKNKSMTFAGNMPEDSNVRFMKANFDKIIESAGEAAKHSIKENDKDPNFVLLISCVGRKLVLGHRTEEEVEAVGEIFGQSNMAGYYSYGEISPNQNGTCSDLHNQTMTITTFSEN